MLKSVFKGLLLIFLATSLKSFGSNISGLSDTNAPSFVGGGLVDKLVVNLPNAHGISYNKVDNFTIDQKLLLIPKNNLPNNTSTSKLKTIIVHANSVSLNAQLALASQDSANLIVIVNKSAGQLSCNNCEFTGFPRVTLATATTSNTLNASMSQIGLLRNTSSSSISINNLSAPDANSVEFHSQSISTAGNIRSVFYAKKSSGQYVISDSGELGVNAGFNFFVGPLHINYDSHEVAKSYNSTSTNTFNGKIHGAGFSIVSARPVSIASNATLTTQSDIAASGHVGDDFFVPTGNIDIVTTGPSSSNGLVRNYGKLFSDASINVTAGEFDNRGMLLGDKSEVVIKNTFKNTGFFETTGHIELSSKLFDNRKSISSNSLTVRAEDALFNHLGGRILGNVVKLESKYFINGARIEKVPSIEKHTRLSIETDLVSTPNYGIFNSNALSVPSSSTRASDVSAHISAVSLSITAEQIENINPYFRVRRDVEIWDGKVELDYSKSRRVSMTAQNTMNLYGKEYVLNSSAIMGLENNGEFTVNTPLFQNERYRVDTKGYIFARKSQNSSEEKHTSIGTQVETHINATSPLAVLYSFGRFNHSPLTSTSSTEFNNFMSFLQVHGISNFYNTNFSSIAVMASSQQDGQASSACFVSNCNLTNFVDNYTQTTFTSFLNDVEGLSSDILVETKVQVEDYIQEHVDNYINAHVEKEKTAFLKAGGIMDLTPSYLGKGFYYNTKVEKHTHGEVLYIDTFHCSGVLDGEGFPTRYCWKKTHSKSVTSIVADVAKDGIVPGTEQTDAQIKELANIYLGNLGKADTLELRDDSNPLEPRFLTQDGFWKYSLSSYEINERSDKQIEIKLTYYRRFYSDEALTDFVHNAIYDYGERFHKTILYSTFKATKPSTPTTYSTTYNEKTGKLTLNWKPV